MDAPASTPAAPESAPAQGENQQKAPDKTPAAPEQATPPPPRRTLKFKAAGQDVEIDEDRAIQELQIGWGAKKKFTELDKARKDFESRKSRLKNPEDDDSEFFKDLGVDRREWLEKKLAKELQREAEDAEMSPDAKRARELEGKLRQAEDEKRQGEETRKQAIEKQEEDQHIKMLDTHMPAALQAVGLPRSIKAIERVATYIRDQLQAETPVTEKSIQFAAQSARDDIVDDTRALIAEMDGKQIVELFGDEVANKVRRYDLQRYEEKRNPGANQPKKEEPPKPKEESTKYMSEREYNAMIRKQFG